MYIAIVLTAKSGNVLYTFTYFSCIFAACTDSKFRCVNTMCISKWLLCDGSNDCGDNSDETIICGKSPQNKHHPVY